MGFSATQKVQEYFRKSQDWLQSLTPKIDSNLYGISISQDWYFFGKFGELSCLVN